MTVCVGHLFGLCFLWAAFHPKVVALLLEILMFGAPSASDWGWIHTAMAAEIAAFIGCAWRPLWRAGFAMTMCVGLGYVLYALLGPRAEECGCLSAWGLVTPAWTRIVAGAGLIALGAALWASLGSGKPDG